MRIVSLASVAILAALAGCSAQDGARPEQAPAAPSAGSDACGASKVSSYLGVQLTDEVLAKIKSASGAQALRVVGPRDAMTMDFREDRLTITTGEDGRIKSLRCV
jgi:hypothetical protein